MNTLISKNGETINLRIEEESHCAGVYPSRFYGGIDSPKIKVFMRQ